MSIINIGEYMKYLLISLLFSLNTFATDYSVEGKKALLPLKKNLMKTLKSAMKEGGPIKAIGACNIEAPKIAKNASNKSYVIGRSSMKYRSEANKPKGWMVPTLTVYKKSKSKKGQVIRLKSGKHAYVEPIYTKAVCLNCHGAKVKPNVSSKISGLYPHDKAMGYNIDEFRGIFWVEFLN